MILHIFKKDLRLLWPFAAGSAAIWFGLVTSNLLATSSPTPMAWTQVSQFLTLASRAGVILLAILAVQQDLVPGTRGDWLSRPVKRSDMLLSKLLFCLVTIGLPVFAAFLIQSLVYGHAFVDAAGAAAATSGTVLLTTAPFVAIAALTESLVQALICAFLLVLGTGLSYMIASIASHMALNNGGLGWMVGLFDTGLVTLGALIILPLQYVRRRTLVARGLTVAGVLIGLAAFALPWRAAFAVESTLSPAPIGAAPVQVALDPSLPSYAPTRPHAPPEVLPVVVSPPQGDSVLVLDHAELTLTGSDGAVLFHGPLNDWMHPDAHTFSAAHLTTAPLRAYQGLTMPWADYTRLSGRPVGLRIDYAFTLFRPGRSATMAMSAPAIPVQGFGACSAQPSEDIERHAQLLCLPTAATPHCLTAQVGTGPEGTTCHADYTPGMLRGTQALGPVRPVATFPLDHALLPGDRLHLTRYEPAGHFTRSLVIANTRLKDWAPVAPRTEADHS